MTAAEFQSYKGIAVAGAFGVSAALQFLAPYRAGARPVLRNWRRNLPMGLVGAAVIGAICGGCVCRLADRFEAGGLGLTNWLHLGLLPRLLVTLLALDFVAWAWHRANHRVPFLWRFHRVHHSDTVFDASTAVRFHPGELVISLGVRLAVVAALGIPSLGLLGFEAIYAFFNFFEHGNTRLPARVEAALATLFITPALHRKHHSASFTELNTNFGTIFSFWDRLGRTAARATSRDEIAVGLPNDRADRGVWQLLLLPAR